MAEAQSKISTVISQREEKEGRWRLPRNSPSQRVAVLLYHHVGDPKPGTRHLALSVTPAKFRRQVRWLRWRGYTAISPAQWLAWYTTGEVLPEKPIMFTFDDAYADCATYAFPALERFGFQSVVFVISGQVGSLTSWDGLPMMTMEQIRHWAARGVEIGAHTRTHPNLTAASDQAVAEEVIGSKEDLIRVGLKPLSFAYPYGWYDDRVRKSVEGIFPLAFTCDEGLNDLRTDPLLLKRIMVQPGDTLLDIEFRAAFGKSPLDWIRSRVRLRSRLKSVLRNLGLLAG